MMADQALTPDTAAIRRDLEYMTARWRELGTHVVFEIRAFKEFAQPQIAKFAPDWMDDAVQWVEQMNGLGFNIYAVRNPIRHDAKGSASDSDIVASFFLWADCDEPASAENVRRWDGPKYSASVVTGRTPAVRVHTYWQLDVPCTDMALWRETQVAIAAHFGSDKTVINPSRIMRVGGTVSYPAKHKAERGYTKELTTIRTTYEDARPPVSLDQMRRAFGSYGPAKSGPSFEIDTGDQPRLDRERATIQAMQGVEWHNAVIRLVGSYVAKGLSDGEIHALTAPLTLAGYTADQTAREVQVAIDGARRKGWTPEAAPVKEMTEEERNAIPAALFRPWVAKDLAAIPYPQFVYSDFYARGYTSVTLAAPKVGKSMLALAEALDMSTGRGFLTGHERQPLRVVYYNAEDDQDVIDGRVAALMKHYGIDQSEIVGRFFPTSGVELDDFFMVAGQDAVINEALFVSIERFCEENAADVLIFDPLQDLSRSPETNEVFRALGGRLRRMANKTKVALGLIHHTRKVAPGMTPSIDDMRGGSALRGTARFNRILVSMTEDEAAKGGLPNHRHFFRIGDMESNLAPPSADVNRWYQKVSVPTPNGQFVGAVEAWEWPDAFNGVTPEDARKVQVAVSHMEDDPPRLSIQSKNWVGYVVARMMSLDAEEKADKARIASMVNAWIKSGVLIVEEVRDTRNGRDAKVILAGPNNPLTGVTA